MNRKFTLAIVFTLAALACVLPVTIVNGQTSKTPKVKFDIRVFDVDLSSGTAMVNITVSLNDLLIDGLQPEEPITITIMGEADYAIIRCNSTIPGGFTGSSGIVPWTLGGALGRGEYIPFEEYELMFQLTNVSPEPSNVSEIEIDTLNSFAFFEGPKKLMLREIYDTVDNKSRLKMSFTEELKAVIHLKRKLGVFGIPSLFWSLIAPTLACYCLLASTLFLRGKKATSNRLRVYLSLFFFSPTFLMSIQGYLPLRTALSIPEVLLENLMISTAIFAIFSLPSVDSNLRELIRDGIMLFFSFFCTSFLLIYLMPVFPMSALSVFQTVILAYVAIALSIWTYYFSKEISARLYSRSTIVLGTLGIFLMDIGFSKATLQFYSTIEVIIGVITGVTGLVLLLFPIFKSKRLSYTTVTEA